MYIYLVDDQVGIINPLATILHMHGHQTKIMENGREALDQLKIDCPLPDLILLDYMMPVMNGLEFRTQQLIEPEFAKIPTCLFTASSSHIDLPEYAFTKILRKPVSSHTILALLEELG